MYRCEECRDTGWIDYRDERGYRYARECACQRRQRAEELLRRSGLAEAVRRQTFAAFSTETDVQRGAKACAEGYLRDLLATPKGDIRPWFYIGGNPGSGKTHLCTAICGELLQRGVEVVYMQWLTDARSLKANVNDDDFDRIASRYLDAPVLYIDDLFKQTWKPVPTLTDADIRLAFTILNSRYIQNRVTLISSEWDLIHDLLPIDEGLFSRVFERCAGHILAIPRNAKNNYRTRKK